jgi:hypothetical protein
MAIESLSTQESPTPDALLRELGRQGASGVLEISHPGDDVSHAWLRDGRVYAMQVPGYRPVLGIRLLSGGLVSPEQLSAAAAAQRDRFPTHLIGQVLVGMGLVPTEVIDSFVREQVLDQVADLLDLPVSDASFHPGRRIQQDTIPPTDVDELLEIARQRRAHRCDVLASIGGPGIVPTLGPPGTGPAQTPLGPYDWALLCRVDGRRDVTELARVCGFTVQEAGQIVSDLALTGLLVVPPPAPVEQEPLAPVVELRPEDDTEEPEPDWQLEGAGVGEPEPVGDLLAEFSAFVHDGPEHAAEPEGPGPLPAMEADQAEANPAAPEPQLAAAGAPPPEPAHIAEVPDREPEHALAVAAATVATATVAAPDPRPADLAEGSVDAAQPGPRARGAGTAEGSPFPAGAPVAPPASEAYSDASVFMRELSSLNDETEAETEAPEAPAVTRLVVPLTEQRRKRRFWDR